MPTSPGDEAALTVFSVDLYAELRKREVLILEEDPWTREALATFFAVEGIPCTAVQRLEEGIKAIREREFGVILCEHWLEGADGLWFLKVAGAAHPESIKVLITAYATDEVRGEAERDASILLLAKPFRVEELEGLLEREIGERNRRRGPVRAVPAWRGELPEAGRFSGGVAELPEKEEEGGVVGRELVDRLIPDPERPAAAAAERESDGPTVVVTDAGGTVISVNEAFEGNEGYSRYEILGKNAAELKNGGGDRRLYRTIWYLARRNALGVGAPASRKEAGDRGTVEVFPVCDSLGRVTNYVAVRQNEAGHRPQKRAAEGSSFPARLSRLTAGIAHDINNQLCVINGTAGMLLGRAGEGESSELRSIRGAAERIASTTRRLLAYARLQEVHPERTDLNAFVASFLDALAADVGQNVELCRELAPELGEVSIDRKLFGQVLADLAESVCRTIPGGGRVTFGTANVDLKDSFVRQDVYMRRGKYVMVSVRHSGEGPGDGPGPRIFEPFFAGLDDPRGLLLPAVYGGVKQSGGYIWVLTRSGDGTTFNIYLPRADQG